MFTLPLRVHKQWQSVQVLCEMQVQKGKEGKRYDRTNMVQQVEQHNKFKIQDVLSIRENIQSIITDGCCHTC